METVEYDVVVIGAGPAGENAAQYAVEGTGMTAVLVEHELLGGECSYWACIPSKALLRPVAAADVTSDLPGVSTAHVAAKALLERRDTWVSHYDDTGQVEWAKGAGLDVVRGAARLSGERSVHVS
jgi:pyruvate/2-oxoglutarate dehydrogenase complex dihydrolipoamide dehydrogenase (E3) component